MQDIQLSPHFKLSELTASATARENGIDNTPPPKIVDNLSHLCEGTLEPLREEIKLPVVITSGYRCKALNERITHHSATSQHMSGCAADFYVGQGSVSGVKSQVSGHDLELETGESPMKHETSSRRERLIKAFRLIITSEKIDYDQVILYPTFIHVSNESRDKNRHRITKANGHGHYRALTREEAMELV
jgi:hypothetical protein